MKKIINKIGEVMSVIFIFGALFGCLVVGNAHEEQIRCKNGANELCIGGVK